MPVGEETLWTDEAMDEYALAGAGLDGKLPDLLAKAGRSS
jgi:hypothetical protein